MRLVLISNEVGDVLAKGDGERERCKPRRWSDRNDGEGVVSMLEMRSWNGDEINAAEVEGDAGFPEGDGALSDGYRPAKRQVIQCCATHVE